MSRSTALFICIFSLVNLSSGQLVVHDFVEVGNPGNSADSTGYGSVAYTYKISKYETTYSQFTNFLQAVATADPYNLYSSAYLTSITPVQGILRMGATGNFSYFADSGSLNKPIAHISWFDAARYCNWLHNGATVGANTEDGAYTLNGVMSGNGITRNSNALFWIPNENEWYKAAYFDPNKNGVGGYWLYPTRSDTRLSGDANVGGIYGGVTDVGTFASFSSAYGTFDQGGNLFELTDTQNNDTRILRGGVFAGLGEFGMPSTDRHDGNQPQDGDGGVGFRVATVPEPNSVALLFLGFGSLLWNRRRS